MTDARKTANPVPRKQYSALTKSQAVLSVWTEKRRTQEVCRELGIHWALLRKWENRALDGMLLALSPPQPLAATPPLSRRIERLLNRKAKALPEGSRTRLERRLESIAAPRPGETPVPAEKSKK